MIKAWDTATELRKLCPELRVVRDSVDEEESKKEKEKKEKKKRAIQIVRSAIECVGPEPATLGISSAGTALDTLPHMQYLLLRSLQYLAIHNTVTIRLPHEGEVVFRPTWTQDVR